MKKKRNKRLYLIAVTMIILSLTASCSLLPKEEKVLAPPLVEPANVEYDVAEVKSGEIIKRLTGTAHLIPANNEVLFYEQHGGRLQKVHVGEGDIVDKGEILIEIDTGNLANDIKQLEIEYKKSDLYLQQLNAQAADKYSIGIAQLDKDGLDLRLSQLREQLASSKIISPINGIVTFITDQNPGEDVEAFQSIVQVADVSNLQLIYSAMSSSDLTDVKIGMGVNLTIEGAEILGEVVQTPESIPEDISKKDPDLYERSILINLDKPPKEMKVGGTAEIEIVTAKKDHTLVIPKNGLRVSGGRNYVLILVDNTKREVDIETGIVSRTEVEIIKGIKEGDQVILK